MEHIISKKIEKQMSNIIDELSIVDNGSQSRLARDNFCAQIDLFLHFCIYRIDWAK